MDSESDVHDSVTSSFSTNNQDSQILLTIPGKVMLDTMLGQLGLPMAVYRRKVYEDHKTCVTVLFQPSKLSFESSFLPMAISGVRSMDVTVAEHTAAIEAIRYVETASNTVVKDLNYERLKQLETENEVLRGKLKDANLRGHRLARGWFLCVRHMCSFSSQIHNVAILSCFGGQEVIPDRMKTAFANIEGIAQSLKSIGADLEIKLQGIRKFAWKPSSYRSSVHMSSVNNKCNLPSTTEDTDMYCPMPRVVKIPSKVILDSILSALGYPKAKYAFSRDECGQVSATVTFYSSAHSPGDLIRLIKIAGSGGDDSKIAEESAGREGIRYMETWGCLDIEDLHYGELCHVRHTEDDIRDQLKTSRAEIDDMKQDLLLAAMKMDSFSRDISDLADGSPSLGQGDRSEGANMAI